MMRLAHVVPTYLPAVRYGGPIFAVHGLCKALAARGHRIDVFTTSVDGPHDSNVPLATPVMIDGVAVHYHSSTALRRLFWSPQLGRSLRSKLPGVSLVHLHSVFLWPTAMASAVARRNGIPYVVSPRGMLVEALIRRKSWLAKSLWLALIEQRTLMRAAAIHATSDLEAREMARFGWRLPQIATIANGVEAPASHSSETIAEDVRQIAATRPVLFLGRLSWKKGLERLLKAFALTHGISLAIAGPDDENVTPALVSLAQSLGILERVNFLPRSVLGADKEHLYACARLFILPSFSENFGNTVIEAMQRGLPVIVTPEVGAAKIVLDAGAGLVVEGEPEPLSTAMMRLCEPVTCSHMGEAGRRYVDANLSWSRIALEMEALYENILSGRQACFETDALPVSARTALAIAERLSKQ